MSVVKVFFNMQGCELSVGGGWDLWR